MTETTSQASEAVNAHRLQTIIDIPGLLWLDLDEPMSTELDELARRLPASASADYGTPFYDIFKRYNNDFYKIDPMLFSPAEVWLTSATSGRTFHAGRLDPDVLRRSLFD